MERYRKIDELLKKGAALLRAAGAKEVYLFGSLAQGREHVVAYLKEKGVLRRVA